MVKNGLYSPFGLSNPNRIETAYLACIGELAFETYLKENNIPYETDATDFSRKIKCDFFMQNLILPSSQLRIENILLPLNN